MPIRQQRKSAVLILALLLLGAIVGSAIALSTVINDSSHQSQTLNDFIAASLAADSGIERGLATVKTGRQTLTQDQTVSNITPAPAISGLTVSGTLSVSNQLKWSLLRPGESVSFDILAPDASLGLSGNANIITVFGSLTNVVGQNSRAKLDLSWAGLDSSGQPYYSGRAIINDPSIFPPQQVDLVSAANLRDISGAAITSALNLNLTRGFRVRIKAVEQVDNLAITPTDNITVESVKQLKVTAGSTFPSRIEITSTGKVNQSQSQKTASVLWQLPSSPALGFVLFTEGDIIPQ